MATSFVYANTTKDGSIVDLPAEIDYTTLDISCQIKLPTGSKVSEEGNSIVLSDGTDISIHSIQFSDLEGGNVTSLIIEDVESVSLEQFPLEDPEIEYGETIRFFTPEEFAEVNQGKFIS
jgi:hypothetical protein